MDKKLTREYFERLSKDDDYIVRDKAVRNPNCPVDILKKLSKDESWYVRSGVAENPNCPNWLKLEAILNDK